MSAAEPRNASQIIHFSVQFENATNFSLEDHVYVVGNHPQLGNWEPDQALELSLAHRVYTAQINTTQQDIRYRYFIGNIEGSFIEIKLLEAEFNPRKFDFHKENVDVFGKIANKSLIQTGWLRQPLVELTFINLIISNHVSKHLSVKLKLIEDNKLSIDVQNLNRQSDFYPQPESGKIFEPHQELVFQFKGNPKTELMFSIHNHSNLNGSISKNSCVGSTPPFSIVNLHSHLNLSSSTPFQNVFIVDTDNNISKGSLNLTLYDKLPSSNITNSSNVIGSMQVKYLVINPVPFPINLQYGSQPMIQEFMDVGHRGMGSSYRNKKPPNMMENTIASLASAFNNGSNFVEFDVQTTLDGVPIIYHDFNVVSCMAQNTFDLALVQDTKTEAFSAEKGNGDNSFMKFGNLTKSFAFNRMGIHQLTYSQLKTLKLYHETLLDEHADSLNSTSLTRCPKCHHDHYYRHRLSTNNKNIRAGSNNQTNENMCQLLNSKLLPNSTCCPHSFNDFPNNIVTNSITDNGSNMEMGSLDYCINCTTCETQIANEMIMDEKATNMRNITNKAPNASTDHTTDNCLSKDFDSQFHVFPLLRTALETLDPNLGFNIEFKYPMSFVDGSHESIDGRYQELNQYCDSILRVIFTSNTQNRPIVFSSFQPDVCKMLRVKQGRYPVYFLFSIEEPGSKFPFYTDQRTKNETVALHFSSANQLAGLSILDKTLLRHPHIADWADKQNLKLVVWGLTSSDAENKEKLNKLGVKGIIYDRVP